MRLREPEMGRWKGGLRGRVILREKREKAGTVRGQVGSQDKERWGCKGNKEGHRLLPGAVAETLLSGQLA